MLVAKGLRSVVLLFCASVVVALPKDIIGKSCKSHLVGLLACILTWIHVSPSRYYGLRESLLPQYIYILTSLNRNVIELQEYYLRQILMLIGFFQAAPSYTAAGFWKTTSREYRALRPPFGMHWSQLDVDAKLCRRLAKGFNLKLFWSLSNASKWI